MTLEERRKRQDEIRVERKELDRKRHALEKEVKELEKNQKTAGQICTVMITAVLPMIIGFIVAGSSGAVLFLFVSLGFWVFGGGFLSLLGSGAILSVLSLPVGFYYSSKIKKLKDQITKLNHQSARLGSEDFDLITKW